MRKINMAVVVLLTMMTMSVIGQTYGWRLSDRLDDFGAHIQAIYVMGNDAESMLAFFQQRGTWNLGLSLSANADSGVDEVGIQFGQYEWETHEWKVISDTPHLARIKCDDDLFARMKRPSIMRFRYITPSSKIITVEFDISGFQAARARMRQ